MEVLFNNKIMTKTTTETISINWEEYIKKSSVTTEIKNKDDLTYCIVRTYSAGVWAGWIKFPSELWEIVYEARRLYQWDSAFTLSD